MNYYQTYLYFLFIRVFLAIQLKTFYHPDEFWQGPEIAFKEVFGYGKLSWEWTTENPLRSPLYHSIFTLFYKILQSTNMNTDFLVSYGPRIVQAFISALTDVFTIKFLKQEGIIHTKNIFIVMITSWFPLYVQSRTFINNFETFLFVIAYFHWRRYQKTGENYDNIICRLLTSINFANRGTSIIPWVMIWPLHWLTYKVPERKKFLRHKFKTLMVNLSTVVFMVVLSISIDTIYHQKLTWCFWNFIQFNVMEGRSTIFGQSNFFLIFGNICFMVAGWSIYLLIGIYGYLKQQRTEQKIPDVFIAFIFQLCFLGLSPHLETRFFLPFLPFVYYWICFGLENYQKIVNKQIKIFKETKQKLPKKYKLVELFILIAFISNIFLMAYFIRNDHIASLKTMEKLRESPNLKSVYFFIISHSTPSNQFLNRNISLYMMNFSPYIPDNESDNYHLYFNTENFVKNELTKLKELPSHIVILDHLYTKTQQTLEQFNYYISQKYYHVDRWGTDYGDFYNTHLYILERQL